MYIWKNDGKGFIYLENQAFSAVNRAISHLYWCSNSELFVDVWLSLEKSIGEFSMVYKKWVLWCGLGPIITIAACNKFNSTRFVQSIPDTLLFHAHLVTCKSAKKWYLMHMCMSWLCPFNLYIQYVPKEHTVNCIKLTRRLVQYFVKRIN